MISEPCTCCHGTGRVEALETSFSKIEQEICRLLVSYIYILGIAHFANDKSSMKFCPNFDCNKTFFSSSFNGNDKIICLYLSLFWHQAVMKQKAHPENPKSWPRFILRVDQHMCNYLTSGKRTRLAILSSSLKVWILLKVHHVH